MSRLTEAEARIKSVKFQCITATLEGVLAMAQTEATLRKSDSWALAAGLLIETLKELEEFNPKSAQNNSLLNKANNQQKKGNK